MIFITRGFVAKFYEPDTLFGTSQQKCTLGFIYSASTMTLEGEDAHHFLVHWLCDAVRMSFR